MLSHIRTQITDSFILALKSVAPDSAATPVLERPKQVAHGDAACNIAMQLERKVQWDPAKERFVNDPEADRKLARAMRAPWTL